jgi:hypothetical protein
MTGEIDAARRILSSELARLDQNAATFLAVAEADYEENKVLADTFERISVANTTELTAAHVASQQAGRGRRRVPQPRSPTRTRSAPAPRSGA